MVNRLAKQHVIIIMAAIFAAMIAYSLIQPRAATREIRVGYLSIISATPLFVAMNEGLFEKSDLNIKAVEFKSSNEISVAAASGAIDVMAVGATNAVLDTMAITGKRFRMFMANQYVKRPNLGSSDFLIAREAITSVRQLKGKRVAFFPGSVGHVFAKEILPKYGINESDVVYIEMPPPQWLAALKSGAVDAVTALEPFSSLIMEAMKVNVLIDGYYAEVMPLVPVSGAWFIEGVLDDATEQKFVEVFSEAIRIIETDRARALSALEKHTGLSKDILQKTRLLKWSLTTDAEARKNAIDLVALFVKQGGIASAPKGDDWLWSPRN